MQDPHSHSPALPEPKFERAPSMIGRFQIEGLMERGGMSLLYMGVHPETLEAVIVKVLSPKFLSSPEVVGRFINEAHIISFTDHPNIVKLYEYGEWEGGLYIAMEFVRGTSLRKILAHQPFSLRRALEVILEISYALCHLHTHGVVHGDLKPENILITDDGCVKVIDFGIAKMLLGRNESKEDVNKIVGTPIYMSPEVQESPDRLTFQSDIYSLGIIAYELVIGKITHGKVILSLAPKGMQKILQKALQPRLEDRYQDIVDFITDLSNYINSAEVEKDKQGPDYFFEMYEKMESRHNVLLKQDLPTWATIGLIERHGMGQQGLYYEFFEKGPLKTIVLAQCPSKGATGVLEAAMVRSYCRALNKLELPYDEYFERVRVHLTEDAFLQATELCVVVIDQTHNRVMSKSTGAEALYKSSKTTLESIQEGVFQEHERLLIAGFHLPEEALQAAIKESAKLDPQRSCEAILRKLRLRGALRAEHPLLLLSIEF